MTSTETLTAQLARLAEPLRDDQIARVLEAVGLVDHYYKTDSPVGPAWVAYNKRGISLLRVGESRDAFVEEFRRRFGGRLLRPTARSAPGVATALRSGRGRTVDADLRGLSDFQRDVLTAARDIPVGEVRPYRWITERIGRPNAVRAVGTALGNNPVPLLIPCHRVTRNDGGTGDYVFGAELKRSILEGEGANLAEVANLADHGVHFIASRTTGIFCHPSCHDARRIAESNRIEVRTRTDATQQGLRPCQICQPVAT